MVKIQVDIDRLSDICQPKEVIIPDYWEGENYSFMLTIGKMKIFATIACSRAAARSQVRKSKFWKERKMKLVEIKDVRPGQIRKVTAFNQWKDEEEFEVLAVIEASGLGEYAEFDTYAEFYDIKTKQLMEDDSEELRFYENGELIGKLGITTALRTGNWSKFQEQPNFKLMMLSNSNGATHDFMLSTAKSTSASRKATQTTLALKPQTTSMEAANWWILNSNVSASSALPTNL